jgi:hypothetical protein
MKEDDAASLASRSHQQRKIWQLASESSVIFSVSSFNPLQLLYNFSPSTSLVSTRHINHSASLLNSYSPRVDNDDYYTPHDEQYNLTT